MCANDEHAIRMRIAKVMMVLSLVVTVTIMFFNQHMIMMLILLSAMVMVLVLTTPTTTMLNAIPITVVMLCARNDHADDVDDCNCDANYGFTAQRMITIMRAMVAILILLMGGEGGLAHRRRCYGFARKV